MALTADRSGRYMETYNVEERPVLLGAVNTGYLGGLLALDRSTGYGAAAADAANLSFAGVMVRSSLRSGSVDNSAGAAGDIKAYVKQQGMILLTISSGTLSQANVGTVAYMVSDDTFNLAGVTTVDIPVGIIREVVSTTQAWIEFDVPAGELAVLV